MRSTRTTTVAAIVLVGLAASPAVATADPTPAPPPGPKTTIDGDGTYAVGKDIQPGTYSSAGPVGDGACYWKRTNGTSIVDNALSKKAQIVQIEPTDTSFTTTSARPGSSPTHPSLSRAPAT
jgi:hypothetical protein